MDCRTARMTEWQWWLPVGAVSSGECDMNYMQLCQGQSGEVGRGLHVHPLFRACCHPRCTRPSLPSHALIREHFESSGWLASLSGRLSIRAQQELYDWWG